MGCEKNSATHREGQSLRRDGNVVKTALVIGVTVSSASCGILWIRGSARNANSYNELCVPSQRGAPAVRLQPQK